MSIEARKFAISGCLLLRSCSFGGEPAMNGSEQPKKYWLLPGLLLSLVLSAVYLYCFPQPTLICGMGLLFHTFVVVIVAIVLVRYLPRILREANDYARVGWSL